jgi:hypothetical protein
LASGSEIDEIILTPMLRAFVPPKGMELTEERLQTIRAIYQRGLAPYSRVVLVKAWDSVTRNHFGWEWPTLQEIVLQCNRHVA